MHVTPDNITNDIPVLRLFYILTLINKRYNNKLYNRIKQSSINSLTLTPPQLHHCVSVYVTSSCLVCSNLNNNIHSIDVFLQATVLEHNVCNRAYNTESTLQDKALTNSSNDISNVTV